MDDNQGCADWPYGVQRHSMCCSFGFNSSMYLSSLTSFPHRNSKQTIFHAPSSCSFHTLCFWMPTHFSLWRHGQMSWHLSPRWSTFQRCLHVARFIARHLNMTFDPFQQLEPQSLHLYPPFPSFLFSISWPSSLTSAMFEICLHSVTMKTLHSSFFWRCSFHVQTCKLDFYSILNILYVHNFS